MHTIDDEMMRAKMRKLRVSTFADIFYEIVSDEAYADALPEDISSQQSTKPMRNANNAISPKQSARRSFATPTPVWLKLLGRKNEASTFGS